MVHISLERKGEDALLHLPVKARRGLASVLADWLNVYAGMRPDVLRREHFYLVVELRRQLLAADEHARAPAAEDGAGVDGGWAETH